MRPVQQCGFAGPHGVPSLNQLYITQDFNGALDIVVMTPKAWKKEVFLGPRPVFWAGTVISHGQWRQHGRQHVPDLSEVLLGEHKAHNPPGYEATVSPELGRFPVALG